VRYLNGDKLFGLTFEGTFAVLLDSLLVLLHQLFRPEVANIIYPGYSQKELFQYRFVTAIIQLIALHYFIVYAGVHFRLHHPTSLDVQGLHEHGETLPRVRHAVNTSIQLKDPSTELLGEDRLPLAAWIARFACDPRRSRAQNWVGPEKLSPLYVREKVAQTISERLVTPDLVWSPMRLNDLASVMVIENQAYPFPWTSGNFTDSLTAGYEMSVLKEQNVMVGYLVWMAVVDEVHLLNIALSPARQGRGLGLWMMRYFITQARARGFSKILLEVRPSNHGAIRLYRFLGFQKIGQRKGYYPQSADSSKEREDAIVMQLALTGDQRV
jgi:ribosomal-protein-alanine N-acetyltransferase